MQAIDRPANVPLEPAMQLNRTFLFAPANHERRSEKVFTVGADAAILDLEDAVANAEKAAARTSAADALRHRATLGSGTAVSPRTRAYVRVNALDTGLTFDDLDAVIVAGLDGIVLPKVNRPADAQMVDWVMTSLEARRGLTPGMIDLMPLIETAAGLGAVRDIANCGVGRMKRLSFGAGDYTRDLGMEWSRAEGELLPARSEMVLAARMAGLEPPIDTVFIHINDADGFAASATCSRDLGFQGRLCIHPDQVAATHTVFTPDVETAAWAARIIEAFDEAERAGLASIQVDGYFVDYPIVEKARRIVQLADAARVTGADH
ncbi:MAG: CoA ester lyase [Pseudomonadota bacterium]